MQKWTDFFDRTFVINLKKRPDRMLHITNELNKYGIGFERKEAVEHFMGAEGLRLTMVEIFTEAIEKGWENVLIFEDDVKVVCDNINVVMQKVIEQIPPHYLICYLGCNLSQPVKGFYSDNLIHVNDAYSTHACFYSKRAMDLIMKSYFYAPIDLFLVYNIQNKFGNCYCTFPFLCTQIEGVSDIENRYVDWKIFLETRYKERIAELQSQ